MAYGVKAYTVKWELFEKFVFGIKSTDILRGLNMYNGWHDGLTSTFKGSKSITPKKAIEEIVNGNITRSDHFSGAMYRYVIEKLFYYRGRTIFRAKKGMPWFEEVNENGGYKVLSTSLESSAFYPIDFESIKQLFFDYEDFPIPIPSQEDFPITSLIRYEKLIELRADFSKLNLPIECNEEFQEWLEKAVSLEHDLVLYYY